MGFITQAIAANFAPIGLAFLPDLLPDSFIGIICSVVIYGMGCGLIFPVILLFMLFLLYRKELGFL